MSLPQIVLVFRALIIDAQNRILLVKRADSDAWMPSLWEVPGGKLEDGDQIESVIHTEIFEETGLKIKVEPGLAFQENGTISAGRYTGMPYLMVTLLAREFSGDVKLSAEHSDYKWLHYEQCLKLELTEPTRNALIAFKQIL